MTAPALEVPDGLDQLDAAYLAGNTIAAVPDPLGDAAKADPAVAAHLQQIAARGAASAKADLFLLRVSVLPAAEAAAAPFVKALEANDAALESGALAKRYGAPLAAQVHRAEALRLKGEMAPAVHDALQPFVQQLDTLEANHQAAATAAAAELPTPSGEALDALKVLLGLLPNLSPKIAVAELEKAVGAAARSPGARGNLRYLLPVARSLAERPEYAPETDPGTGLAVVLRRAEALTQTAHGVAAETVSRYAARLRYELGLVESAVAHHGRWAASHDAAVTEARGGGVLKVILVPAPLAA